jgi:hypothetical protein
VAGVIPIGEDHRVAAEDRGGKRASVLAVGDFFLKEDLAARPAMVVMQMMLPPTKAMFSEMESFVQVRVTKTMVVTAGITTVSTINMMGDETMGTITIILAISF